MIDQQKKKLRILCSRKRNTLKRGDNNFSSQLIKKILGAYMVIPIIL